MSQRRIQRTDLAIDIIAIRLYDAIKMFEVLGRVVRFAGGGIIEEGQFFMHRMIAPQVPPVRFSFFLFVGAAPGRPFMLAGQHFDACFPDTACTGRAIYL